MADEMAKNGDILKVLTAMRADLSAVKADVTFVKSDLTLVKSDVAHMRADHAGRFDSIGSRFTILETRFDGMERRVAQDLSDNSRKVDKVLARLDAVDKLNERVSSLDSSTSDRLAKLENRVDFLERELHKVSG